jgi:antibiotic biosynthesis monooxygenase (ABM) superfamily enzyme
MVVTRDVVPGRERDFDEWVHLIVSEAVRFGGQGASVITPDASMRTHRVVVCRFANEDSLKAWEESEEHNRLMQEAEEFSTPRLQRATGLETWFTLPGEGAMVPPPRWKMALVTLIGIYPPVVVLLALVVPRVEAWPLLARAAVIPLVLVPLLTYIIMPLLSRLLRDWLYPHKMSPPT